MTRRDVVRHTAVLGTVTLVGGGSVLALPAGAVAAERPGPGDAPKRPTSPNGWELEEKANDVSTVWTRPVPGTGLDVDVRIGDVETVLVHVVRRFHYEIDELRKGDQPAGAHRPGSSRIGRRATRGPAPPSRSGPAPIRPE
ncbi:hypothetical protein [Streptomyces phaeochromogenes]|uniref:hypothetical protein n=1 Tax=Streptomyces phaeochromogenes TaxID=1923 RepID=UPI0038700286